ncbi:hypothetical protein ACFQH9_09905, partial [Pseudonocardia lutea]
MRKKIALSLVAVATGGSVAVLGAGTAAAAPVADQVPPVAIPAVPVVPAVPETPVGGLLNHVLQGLQELLPGLLAGVVPPDPAALVPVPVPVPSGAAAAAAPVAAA